MVSYIRLNVKLTQELHRGRMIRAPTRLPANNDELSAGHDRLRLQSYGCFQPRIKGWPQPPSHPVPFRLHVLPSSSHGPFPAGPRLLSCPTSSVTLVYLVHHHHHHAPCLPLPLHGPRHADAPPHLSSSPPRPSSSHEPGISRYTSPARQPPSSGRGRRDCRIVESSPPEASRAG